MSLLTFQELSAHPELIHGFSLRSDSADTKLRPAEEVLTHAEISPDTLVQAEQPHGNLVGTVKPDQAGSTVSDVDALISNTPDIVLVIRVADCGAVFLFDPVQQVIGLAHSGKKGTAANILEHTITGMQQAFQTDPKDLIAVLAPCIRPPHYEVNFAETIAKQVLQTGVRQFADCGKNTATDLNQYYSYRMEQGQTGRHYAFIGIKSR